MSIFIYNKKKCILIKLIYNINYKQLLFIYFIYNCSNDFILLILSAIDESYIDLV